jgi:hypothetical protein
MRRIRLLPMYVLCIPQYSIEKGHKFDACSYKYTHACRLG